MAVEVTIKDNLPEVLHLFESAKSKALLAIGETVREDAIKNSPKRTGALQQNWVTEVNEGQSYVKIGVPLDALKGNYAKYVELGTSRGQLPRHMLQNAVNANRGQFEEIAKAEIKNA